ncbi:hypothetical protein H5J22_06650 [Cetobacterium sp. 8H]|uniref:hypothetical protein n=1 Tax=Cetobacterium sp. 8H TaxID=2759681 RepID=UPI00163BF24E|nr:hypothetical protein [Cetobacterium sp. 8H]MBC2851092.1 hypothetical protein [Cetobacterium sp. 8H]
MKNSKKRLKNKGIALPLTLFVLTTMVWFFSLLLIFYKNEVESIKGLTKYNDTYWSLENLSDLAEYEIFKADKEVNNNKFTDILEYFEGIEKVWLKQNQISKSGYGVKWIKKNNILVEGDLKLTPNQKNILTIQLIKTTIIDNQEVVFKINVLYEYPIGEVSFEKSSVRQIIDFGVECL